MKENLIKKIFTVLGFLVLAFVALNMNACSKDKKNNTNPNPNGQYGYGPGVGGGVLANAVGSGYDIDIRFTISGVNGGQAGATGILFVKSNTCPGLFAGQTYNLQTIAPGVYYNGDFFPTMGQGFTMRTQNGIDVYVEGFLTNQQEPDGARRMSGVVVLTGCGSMNVM